MDLRLVTTYTNDGAAVTCHTFQRRFSQRYLPLRPAAPDAAAPAAEAASQHALSAGSGVQGEQGEEGGEVALDEAALADSERRLADTLGPLDPCLKMAARKAAHALVGAAQLGEPGWGCCCCVDGGGGSGLLRAPHPPAADPHHPHPPTLAAAASALAPAQVQYVQKAHLLTLRGLVCEFARGADGHLWLLGPLRADWASLIPGAEGRGLCLGRAALQCWRVNSSKGPCTGSQISLAAAPPTPLPAGRGGEPWAAANLTKQPVEEESWPSAADEDEGSEAGGEQQQAQQALEAAAAAQDGAPPATADIADRLLPPPALLPLPGSQQPGSPGIPAVLAASVSTPLLPALAGGSPQHPPSVKAGLRRSPAQGSKGSPSSRCAAGSPTAAGSCHWGAASGGGECGRGSPGARAPPGLASHFTRRLVSLEDELLVQSDLAEGLAGKVGFEAACVGLRGVPVGAIRMLAAPRSEAAACPASSYPGHTCTLPSASSPIPSHRRNRLRRCARWSTTAAW